MRRPVLRLVSDNTARHAARAAAERDYLALIHRLRYLAGYMLDCMAFPFRIIFAVWDFGLNVCLAFVRGTVRLFFAVVGLGLIASVACGVGYVLFYPLFH